QPALNPRSAGSTAGPSKLRVPAFPAVRTRRTGAWRNAPVQAATGSWIGRFIRARLIEPVTSPASSPIGRFAASKRAGDRAAYPSAVTFSLPRPTAGAYRSVARTVDR